jgi:protein tyrosine/serine phosphatase
LLYASVEGKNVDTEEAATTAADHEEDILDEQKFKEEIRQLCVERNLPLEKVKNCRDLAATKSSPIKPGRLFRTGRLGDATAKDRDILFNQLGLRTLVDLRSPTELKDDDSLMSDVFDGFTDLVWIENGRRRDGCLRELEAGVSPVEKSRRRYKSQNGNMVDAEEEMCEIGCDDPKALPAEQILAKSGGRKERHFVSLMNEFKYVRGTVTKLRKRDIAKALFKAPGAFLSKRIWNSLKKPFITEINSGGLIMLTELLLRFGAPGIKYVLDLCAESDRYPVAFYCTAGKDRTGMITAIILSICGVEPEDIVEDYSLSANVYAEMNDHQAMVGALSQRALDPKTFLGAPPEVMADTLISIKENYGSVEGYCDFIGFGPEQREKLKKALTED